MCVTEDDAHNLMTYSFTSQADNPSKLTTESPKMISANKMQILLAAARQSHVNISAEAIINVTCRPLSFSHLSSDMSLDFRWVLHSFGAKNTHQVCHANFTQQ